MFFLSRNLLIFFVLTILLIVFFGINLSLGSLRISLFDIFFENISADEKIIFFDFRLPRALAAMLVGMSLSVSGLQMQTIFRNPLAGPYVLGVTSGASLGVAILVLGFSILGINNEHFFLTQWSIVSAAFAGSFGILFFIFILSLRVKDMMTILILGILLGSATSAMVDILQYFGNAGELKIFVIWTMGNLGGITQNQLFILSICSIIGIFIAIFSTKTLNGLLLGENFAKTIGIPVKKARTIIFISTGILAGSVTAFCGPVGFVGMVVPHLSRLLFQTANHQVLIPASILIGGILMSISDILTRIILSEKILPINSITSLIGIPVVIWLVIKNQRVM